MIRTLGVIAVFVATSGQAIAQPKAPPVLVDDRLPTTNSIPSLRYISADGTICVRGADGVYRSTGDKLASSEVKKATPAVVASQPFRNGDYHAGHNCPTCGRSQYVISGYNRDGTHTHTCSMDGTVWRH